MNKRMIIMLGLIFMLNCYALPKAGEMPVVLINIKNQTFSIWLPVKPEHYQQGLKQVTKEQLHEKGMLFTYPKNHIPVFTMEGTLTDIDFLCLSEEGILLEVLHMKKAAKKLYKPFVPCEYVLELSGGTVKQYQLRPGDRIKLPATR